MERCEVCVRSGNKVSSCVGSVAEWPCVALWMLYGIVGASQHLVGVLEAENVAVVGVPPSLASGPLRTLNKHFQI